MFALSNVKFSCVLCLSVVFMCKYCFSFGTSQNIFLLSFSKKKVKNYVTYGYISIYVGQLFWGRMKNKLESKRTWTRTSVGWRTWNTLKCHKLNLKNILQDIVGDKLVIISIPMKTEWPTLHTYPQVALQTPLRPYLKSLWKMGEVVVSVGKLR